MIRLIVLFTLIIIIAGVDNCFSQNSKSEWNNQPLDSLVEGLEELLVRDMDSTLFLVGDVINRARTEKKKFLEAKARRIQISALWLLGNYDEALDSIAISQKLIATWTVGLSGKRKADMEMLSIGISNEEGRLNSRLGKHKEAIRIYKENISKLETMAQSSEIKKKKAAFMANIAISYKIIGGKLDSVIIMYEKSLAIFRELGDSNYISRLNLNLGIAIQSKGDYQRALELYLEGYKLAKENDLNIQGNFLISLVSLYKSLKDYDSAIKYGEIGLALVERKNDLPLKAFILLTLGSAYMDLEKLDSTFYYLEKSLSISEPLNDVLNQIDAYHLMAKAYAKQDNFEKALHYVDLGFKALEGHEDRFLELELLRWKSKCMLELNDFKSSQIFIERALDLLEEEGNNSHKRNVYSVAHEVFSTLGNHELAYKYLRKYTSYQDSVLAEEKTLEIARIEYKHRLESTLAVKDAEMAQQDAEIKKQKYQVYLLITVLLLLLTAAGALFQRLKVARIKNELIEKQKKLDMSLLISDNKMRHSFNQQLEKKLDEIVVLDENEIKPRLKSYLLDIKRQLGIEDRLDHLSENLDSIHSDFDGKLTANFPDLTASEREICHLIRLNMSIKDIAQHRNTSVGAIKSARHRIKTKLNIEADELDSFIRNQL